MKKLIYLFALLSTVLSANAQLLITDSSFRSDNGGQSFKLAALDSTYRDPTHCRIAYAYSKEFDIVPGLPSTGKYTDKYTVYDYYDNGNQRQVVTQLRDTNSNTYVNAFRNSTTYYQGTSKTDSTLNEIWNNSAWQDSALQINTYDANGYLTVSVSKIWQVQSNQWEKRYEIVYYNNSSGLPDSSITSDFVFNRVDKTFYTYIAGTALPDTIQSHDVRAIYSYNSNGKVATLYIEVWELFFWRLFNWEIYTYDTEGNKIQSYFYNIHGYDSKTSFKYISCNLLPVASLELCDPVGNATLNAGLTGAHYQWQVDTGSGFVNTGDNHYSGDTTQTLNLSNIPSAWYGYQYCCMVDGRYGNVFAIKFINKWTGTKNNEWSDAANWSCGNVPDANTDVIIDSGNPVFLNSNTTVRSLTVKSGAMFTIDPGVKLTLIHK